MKLNELIKIEMKRQNMTAKELSNKTGIRYASLSGFFNGKSLSIENLEKILNTLNSIELFSEANLQSINDVIKQIELTQLIVEENKDLMAKIVLNLLSMKQSVDRIQILINKIKSV